MTSLTPTSTTLTEESSSERKLSEGAKAGIGVGSVAAVTVALVIAVLLVRRWRGNKSQSIPPMGADGNQLPLVADRKTNTQSGLYEMPETTNRAPVVYEMH